MLDWYTKHALLLKNMLNNKDDMKWKLLTCEETTYIRALHEKKGEPNGESC